MYLSNDEELRILKIITNELERSERRLRDLLDEIKAYPEKAEKESRKLSIVGKYDYELKDLKDNIDYRLEKVEKLDKEDFYNFFFSEFKNSIKIVFQGTHNTNYNEIDLEVHRLLVKIHHTYLVFLGGKDFRKDHKPYQSIIF